MKFFIKESKRYFHTIAIEYLLLQVGLSLNNAILAFLRNE